MSNLFQSAAMMLLIAASVVALYAVKVGFQTPDPEPALPILTVAICLSVAGLLALPLALAERERPNGTGEPTYINKSRGKTIPQLRRIPELPHPRSRLQEA